MIDWKNYFSSHADYILAQFRQDSRLALIAGQVQYLAHDTSKPIAALEAVCSRFAAFNDESWRQERTTGLRFLAKRLGGIEGEALLVYADFVEPLCGVPLEREPIRKPRPSMRA